MRFLGLDVGTTGAKALLVDEKGTVLGQGYTGYRLHAVGNSVEQNADDWTEAGARAIQQAIEGIGNQGIEGISVSTQGSSTVAVDGRNRPIGNAMTWMDSRSEAEAEELASRLGRDYIYHTTGWPISSSFDVAKVMFMKRSGQYDHAKRYLSTLEYVNLFLASNPVCDPSNSSIRQFFDIHRRAYDSRILDAAGISMEELPEVLPTGSLIGRLTSSAAESTGLKAGTPIFNGAHDQYCASLGANAVATGEMLLSAGTTWVLMGIADRLIFSDTFIAPGIHPIDGIYGAIASLVGSGSSLQWFKNEFAKEDFRHIDEMAGKRAVRTDGLFFYPHLSGAGYPLWKPQVRGAITGLSLEHDRYDFARAIMEASAFGVRDALADFAANGLPIRTLKFTGGAAKSALWCSLIAATGKVHVEISHVTDSCALGAAMIAACGTGIHATLGSAARAMSTESTTEAPDAELVERMEQKYQHYRKMWNCIDEYYRKP